MERRELGRIGESLAASYLAGCGWDIVDRNVRYREGEIDIVAARYGAEVTCTTRTVAQTGVEMEALTGVAIALLTIYDMCKAVDKKMQIVAIRLLEKTKTQNR